MRNSLKTILVLAFFFTLNAHSQNAGIKKELCSEIKHADIDDNDTISVKEASIIFTYYLSNPARNIRTDLVQDVESVVIDLISYLETINCSALKKTKGSKRFIELYYVNKLKRRI